MKRAGLVLAVAGVLVAGTGAGPLGAHDADGVAASAPAAPAAASIAAVPPGADAVQPDLDPKIVALLNAISEDRLHQIIDEPGVVVRLRWLRAHHAKAITALGDQDGIVGRRTTIQSTNGAVGVQCSDISILELLQRGEAMNQARCSL